MKKVFLSIAGIRTGIHCSSDSLADLIRARYSDFLAAPGDPAYDVHIQLDRNNKPHHHISPAFTFVEDRIFFDLPGYIGYIDPEGIARLRIASDEAGTGIEYFLRVVYAILAYRSNGLMIHAAGVVRNGRAFLFFGHSGSGKTTVTRNSSGDLILNDDLVILLPQKGVWMAYGTPFTNPTQTPPSKANAPIAALLRLVQCPEVYVEPLEGAAALAELITSVPVLNGSTTPPLGRCRQILKDIPTYKLHLLPDPSFWPEIENL